MPPPTKHLASYSAAPVPVVYSEHHAEPREASRLSLGAEFGALGRPDSTNGTILGMTPMMVGRVFAEYAVTRRFIIRPSFGYFSTSDGEGQVSVSQADWELGATAFYRFPSEHAMKFQLGLAQRLIRVTSSYVVFGATTNNPGSFQYRLGPAGSMELPVSHLISLLANAETTVQIASPMRMYMGLTAGILFHLR